MSEVILSLEKYRGRWYARGHDAFKNDVKQSLGLSADEPEKVALIKLSKAYSDIVANGGLRLTGGSTVIVNDLIDLYTRKGVKSTEDAKISIVVSKWGKTPLAKLDEAAMLGWERELINRKLSPATIKRYGGALRAIVSYGCKSLKMTAPVLPVIGSDTSPRVMVISQDTRDLVLSHMREHELWFFIVLLNCGARPSELIRLKWSDVCLTRSVITLSSYKGKNGLARVRTIPFSKPIREVLEAIQARYGSSHYDYVFRNGDGEAIAEATRNPAESVRNMLYRAAREAGVGVGVKNRFCPYAFRHTFGTNAGNNGSVNPMLLSSYMGHAKVQVTKDNYFHGGVEDADLLTRGL